MNYIGTYSFVWKSLITNYVVLKAVTVGHLDILFTILPEADSTDRYVSSSQGWVGKRYTKGDKFYVPARIWIRDLQKVQWTLNLGHKNCENSNRAGIRTRAPHMQVKHNTTRPRWTCIGNSWVYYLLFTSGNHLVRSGVHKLVVAEGRIKN